MQLKLSLRLSIKTTLIELGYYNEDIEILMEFPKDKTNGDYASNIAMKLAKVARKAPIKIAEEIAQTFHKEGLFIDSIVVANPGFINFFIETQKY